VYGARSVVRKGKSSHFANQTPYGFMANRTLGLAFLLATLSVYAYGQAKQTGIAAPAPTHHRRSRTQNTACSLPVRPRTAGGTATSSKHHSVDPRHSRLRAPANQATVGAAFCHAKEWKEGTSKRQIFFWLMCSFCPGGPRVAIFTMPIIHWAFRHAPAVMKNVTVSSTHMGQPYGSVAIRLGRRYIIR